MEHLSCSGSGICSIVDDVGHNSLLVFITGVIYIVIQPLLEAVASDVFYLAFRNAGTLQFLNNRFPGTVAAYIFCLGRHLSEVSFCFIVFIILFMVFFPLASFCTTRWSVACR